MQTLILFPDGLHHSLYLLSSDCDQGHRDRGPAAHQQEQRHQDLHQGDESINANDNVDDEQEDEELITEFATFISLALHHAKLYDKLRRSENSVAVIEEVKAYHAQAKQDEVDEIIAEGPPNPEDNQDVSSQM